MDDFHISDYSIWEDFEIEGWPVMTIMRGTVAVGERTAHRSCRPRPMDSPQS